MKNAGILMNLYCIRDLKGSYQSIYCFLNDAYAVRFFKWYLENEAFYKDCKQDFALMYVGMFDTEDGSIFPADDIKVVFEGRDLLV